MSKVCKVSHPSEAWRLVARRSLGPIVYGEVIGKWRRNGAAQLEYLGRLTRSDTAYRSKPWRTTIFVRSGRLEGVLRRAPVVWRGVEIWGARFAALRAHLPARVKVIDHGREGVEACYSDAGVTLWVERGRVVEVITSSAAVPE